jgi:hypothetical protein
MRAAIHLSTQTPALLYVKTALGNVGRQTGAVYSWVSKTVNNSVRSLQLTLLIGNSIPETSKAHI